MISMPEKWLFVLNKFNRAVVPRKCVFFSFMFVIKFADHCLSGYLSSPANSEIPLWFAVSMSSYPGPCSLGTCSLTHSLILSSCLSTCWNWPPREPFGLAYAHHTMGFIPPLPHPLQPTRLSATNSWLAFPLSLGPRATIHCQQPGDIGLKSFSVWIPLVASLCSWDHTQTLPQDD